ncbi:MAG: HAD family phosphatase [Lachnospiraceae bacterium]|nr:HAD family phosphatase [Lachnospiraceae bacterium]
MDVKAILFDMDGVLIDAKEWHYEALNRALKLFGFEISRFEHIHTFDGLPTKDKLKLLSEGSNLPIELHDFINAVKQKYTMELINERCKPRFQHEYALSRLKEDGYKIAVCSNSIRKTIEEMMDKSELMPYIDLIMSNQDVTKAKPDPEIYVKSMKKFKLRPEECLILEDNKNGIKAALASGGHLLKVDSVYDVNYENITNKLKEIKKMK